MTPTIMVKVTVLKIQVHNINFMYDAAGTTTGMSITLPFCKTHQTGDIKPYFLWAFHQSETHLCALSEQFLEMFRNSLLDLNINPAAYGTHSFRWGGCQKICEWGGWSQEFTNLTIVKYLISVNDDAMEAHKDFFNPNHCPALKCPHCG
ncbi:hypothetical protein BKA82DRAFT_15456 [Pisolithus tinctorius]|uniref:Uncharacterized protein n=1 Tax=Pisolithus tinctorius Marx 270 TaxID=870435 RepID=A0A0C3P9R2_PISTI|nr:hypothetical protein BKA82DRAFT_15456 [Pisolithus tinctorius]KIO04596.1 hypothetical protein M404DRAFT_15456 [Pisolithus tinctorius Marx 270]